MKDLSDIKPGDVDLTAESNFEDFETDEYFDCAETFDVEVEPTFIFPYNVAKEADPACVMMDKLIREGKLSQKSFFYRNFCEVAKHLDNPNSRWDPEICEALMSIKHLGGRATMNHVVGPLGRGQGSQGRRDAIGTTGAENCLKPVLNYGGPGNFVLQKYVPGTMPISGISKHLLLSCLRLLDLSEVKTASPTCEVFSVALQLDGTMVRAGLVWDSKLGFAVGCQEPLTYQDLLDKNFHLTGEFLKKNLVTEVDVCVLVSLCSTVSLSLGYQLQPSSGKTGCQVAEKYTEIIKTVSKCEACVKSKSPQLNTIPPQTPCNSLCPECWSKRELCPDCSAKGRKTIYPQLESCFQCLEKGLKCKKVLVQVLALDCFTGNRFLIEKFQKELLEGTKDPEVFLTEVVGEIIHLLKTIKSSFSNWFLLGLSGNIINLSMLRTLRDDNPNKEISCSLRKVLQKGSVVNRDRQDTDCLIEFKHAIPVLREVSKVDPVVVHQICPEKFKLEPTNKPGSLGPVRFLGAVNIGHIAVISDHKQNPKKSVLSILELHSPARIKANLEIPHVIGFVASEAMILTLSEDGLMFIEVTKGTVVPKIPSKKKELIALCKELGLSSEGNVKELKSRLTKKLKPTSKMDPRAVKLSPQLASKMKNPIISEHAVKDGIVKSLTLADNLSKKLMLVELDYKGGEGFARVSMEVDFPMSIKDVKLSLNSHGVTLLVSEKQLVVLENFHLLAVLNLQVSFTDMCEINDELFFIQNNQIGSESFENLKKGILNPNILAGSEQRLDKDGSGMSSRFVDPSSISRYQNSITIGTEEGKVKVISDVISIADFLEGTFDVGVEGFGLHKKAGMGNNNADLDSCQAAHEKIGEYLDKLDEKIKLSFRYQIPAKLNGPQHSVSAVTCNTVKLAQRSFVQIKQNVKLASGEDYDLLSSSTTTKAVEHFHSLAHRKKVVQTVQEYIQSWAVIVRESAKSLCSWSFQMFSGFKSSYYLKPEEHRIPLSDIPMMPKLPANLNVLSYEENRQAKEICQEHKALPQSSTRTFTSKFKAGTLPLQAYLTADPETELESGQDETQKTLDDDIVRIEGRDLNNSDDGYVDEPPEWDSDSSDDGEGEVEDGCEVEDVIETAGFIHVNQDRVTRSGRRVNAARHFMYDTGLQFILGFIFH